MSILALTSLLHDNLEDIFLIFYFQIIFLLFSGHKFRAINRTSHDYILYRNKLAPEMDLKFLVGNQTFKIVEII